MDQKAKVTVENTQVEDQSLDLTLRPQRLEDFVGQKKIKENLYYFLEAARKRKEPLEHVLLHGGPGLGKTTLAHIISREMNVNIRITSGPALERAGDLAAVLSNLGEGDILFIDEIHRLNKMIEEVLYPAMEEYALDLVIGKGPAARTVRIELAPFTIIGATTKMSLLSSPLRDRFGMNFHLDFYEPEEIKKIVERAARLLSISLHEEAAFEIASRARRTPRIANRLLKRVRDYGEVKNMQTISSDIAKEALALLEVDPLGLDKVDRKILLTIVEKFRGGPVGLQTIAAAVGEDSETIEQIYEPYLMQLGFLTRTPRGREATSLAYQHLGLKPRTLI